MSSILRPKVNLRYLHKLKHCIIATPASGNYPSSKSSVSGIYQQSFSYRVSSAEKGVASVAHNYTLNQEHQEQERKTDNVKVEAVDEALSKIDAYAKRTGRILKKDVYDLFDVVKNLGQVSSIQSLYLIRCCGSLMHDETPSKRTELVNKIWSKIKELEIPLDVSHYNALLKVYLENEQKFLPTDFLCDMERNGIQPNRVTYQRMIERYCEDADINGASTILEYMKDKGIAVTESVFNSLITGHARAKDFDGAKNMLVVMRQSHLTPSADTYTTLACGFAETGDMEGIISTLDEASKCEIYLSARNYLSIIYRLAVSGHGSHIDQIFDFITNIHVHKQDCANVMLDLLNKGLLEESFCILNKTISNTKFRHGEVLFFRQMFDLGKPVKKIIEFCHILKDNYSHEYIFTNTARLALEAGNIECAVELFKEIQNQGMPLRPHYFWPVFARNIQNKDEQGIFETLKIMSSFGIPADMDTYEDYVLPGISSDDPEMVLKNIKESEQSPLSAIEPLFRHYCIKKDLKNALYITEHFNPLYSPRTQQIFLSQYHLVTCDEESFLKVLNHIHQNNRTLTSFRDQDIIGDFFHHLSADGKLSTSLLKRAHKMGISISRPSANAICKSIGRSNPEALQIVRSMQYGVPLPSEVTEHEDTLLSMHPRNMTVENLEEHLVHLKAVGASTRGTLRHLLTLHSKNKDIEKLLSVKNELDSQGFIYTPASYALMIDAFVFCNCLEPAEKLMKELTEKFPHVKLDNVKSVNYATLLVRCNKKTEALDFLKDHCDEISFGDKDMLMRVIKRLLNVVADTGDVELTNNLYNFFMSKLNILSPRFLLEPLVAVHLKRNDLDEAIATYDRFLQNYKFAAARNQIFKKCISVNDFEKLQTVVDLTASYSGKTRTLHELAFSFVECGHIQQAQKVLKTLVDRIDFMHIEDFAYKLLKDSKVTELEHLIEVTKDLPRIDRDKLYYNLLLLYAQNNDYQKAVDLWDRLQEENVQPNIKTLHLLANLLEKNDQPVPFVVPGGGISIPEGNNLTESVIQTSEPDFTQQLKRCLDSEDISGSIEVLGRMKKGHVRSLSVETLSTLIDLLTRNNSLKDISTNVQLMSYLLEKARLVFKPLLKTHSEAGDCETIHRIARFLPDFTLKSIGFNYFFNRAYLASGLHEELLKELEDNVDGNVKLFSFSGFLDLLKAAPQLEGRAVKLVDTYLSQHSFDIPVRALWVHYFTSERFDEAEGIFKQYTPVFTSMDVLASTVLKIVRDTQNDFLGKKFIEFLNKYGFKQVFRDRTYCCVVDVLVTQAKEDEAVELLKEMQSLQISLNQVKRNTLVTLKDNLATKNKVFPFEIPVEEDDGSSSTDSD